MEIPFLADFILQEAAVRLLHPLGEIAEEYERRHYGILKHRDILDLHKFALIARRGSNGHLLKHIRIQLRGRDYAPAILINLHGGLQHLEDALLRQSGSEQYREIRERCEAPANSRFIAFLGIKRMVVDKIPLVDAYHKPLTVALNQREYIDILSLDAACGIDHEDADIARLYGADRTDHAIIFNILTYLLLLADTGSVDKIEIEPELIVFMIDRIAGGAGDIGDDMPLFANKRVYKR